MDTTIEFLDACMTTIMQMSAHAALLICLVLLVQRLLRKQLSAQWRAMLWFLVIARLIVPVFPESTTSVLNVATMFRSSSETTEPHREHTVVEHRQAPPVGESEPPLVVPTPILPEIPERSAESSTEPHATLSQAHTASVYEDAIAPESPMPTYWSVLALLWLTGIVFLLIRTVGTCRRLASDVREMAPVEDQRALDLLDKCAAELGIKPTVVMLEANSDLSPAVVGWRRPKLLMPESVLRTFSDNQLRHVVLHELAHIRRRDIPMLWLVHLVRIVHWFNPLVWLMAWRVTIDRELACDEMVLRHTSQSEAASYGETLLQLVQRPNTSPMAVSAISMAMGGRAAVGQRIARIANYRTTGWRHAVIGFVSLMLLALVGLTSSVTAVAELDDKKAKKQKEAASEDPPRAKRLDFGQNYKPPFAHPAKTPRPKLTAAQKKRRNARNVLTQLRRNVLARGRSTRRNPDPKEVYVLESMLSELHHLHYYDKTEREIEEAMALESYDFLAGLVRQRWHRLKDESPRDMINRIKSSAPSSGGNFREQISSLARYADKSTQPWPYDWREKEDFWLALLETIEDAKLAEQPAEVFRRRLPDDSDAATLYRLAYLRVVRKVPRGSFDLELVRPLLKTDSQQVLIARICDIITAMPTGPEEERTPDFLTMQSRLAEQLAEVEDDTSLAIFLSPFCQANPTILYRLEDWILINASADAGSRLVELMRSPKVAREWLLGRHIDVKFDQTPMSDVMHHLQKEVRFPLWIDNKVLSDKTPVTLTTSGRWFDVMDRVLVSSNYRTSLLWSQVLWVGLPEDRREAELLISRAAIGHPEMTKLLLENSSVEFIDTPLRDVVEYLEDLHSVPIFLTSSSDYPITLNSTSPFLVLLSNVTGPAGYDWVANGEVIVVGKPDQIATFQRDEDQRFRKLLFRRSRISQELENHTSFEFIETPLSGVTDYLSTLHGLPIVALGNEDLPITAEIRSVALSTALSLLNASHGLVWNCDNDVIVVGPADKVTAYVKRSINRPARLKGLPLEVIEKLHKPHDFDFDETPLNDVAAFLSKATSIPTRVVPGQDLKTTQPISQSFSKLPFDVQLDLLTIRNNLFWEFKDGEILIRKP